jgi:hypothetical protein
MKLNPKLQTALTKLEAELPPGAMRRAAVADCIAQALDLKQEREKLRASMKRLEAAQAALAIPPRAKPRAAKPSPARAAKPSPARAVKPSPAARPSTAPTAPTATRRDRREPPLPLAGWSFGHLAIEAENGSPEALAELQRRGFIRSAPNTFSRTA